MKDTKYIWYWVEELKHRGQFTKGTNNQIMISNVRPTYRPTECCYHPTTEKLSNHVVGNCTYN